MLKKVISINLAVIIFLSMLFVNSSTACASTVSEKQVNKAITSASQLLLSLQKSDGYWCSNIRINPRETAYFMLTAKYLGFTDLKDDINTSTNWLLTHVNDDGGWGFFDNGGDSDISITAIVRLALSVNGVDENNKFMQSSLKYIENNGGISNSDLFCKVFYYLFDQYKEPWNDANSYIFFPSLETLYLNNLDENSICSTMAWGREAGIALSVIKEYKLKEDLHLKSSTLALAEEYIVSHQLEDGCWYTLLGTCLNMIALNEMDREKHWDRIENGMDWINSMRDDDGYQRRFRLSVWDTSYSISALRSTGVSSSESILLDAARWLVNAQTTGGGNNWSNIPSGGWSYNEYNILYPDCDDTALAIMSLNNVLFTSYTMEYKKRMAVKLGNKWLHYMQNDDGGFGTFCRFAGDEDDKDYQVPMSSVEDSSVADITGHVLSALGSSGYTTDDEVVTKAVEYLKKDQNKQGAWYGRWGLCYLYGTSMALQGLYDVGYDMSDDFVVKAADWFVSNQNEDGGWGEHFSWWSEKNGITFTKMGVSTPEQTAWAIMALMRVDYEKYNDQIKAGIEYLIKTQDETGDWAHEYYTVLGLNPYKNPYYSIYFPIAALSMYANYEGMKIEGLSSEGISMEESETYQMTNSFSYEDVDDNLSKVFDDLGIEISFENVSDNVYSFSLINNSKDYIKNIEVSIDGLDKSDNIANFDFESVSGNNRVSKKIYFTADNHYSTKNVKINVEYTYRGENKNITKTFKADVHSDNSFNIGINTIIFVIFLISIIGLVVLICLKTDKQLLKYSIKNLYRNKLRTTLVFIGIVFGISATAGTISLGQSFNDKLSRDFQSFGNGRIVLIPDKVDIGVSPPTDSLTKTTTLKLDDDVMDDLKTIDNVKSVCPVINSEETVTFKGESVDCYIQFVDDETFYQTTPLQIDQGTMLGDGDNLCANVGYDIWNDAFSEKIGVGDVIKIGKYDVTVNGLFAETDGVSGKIDSITTPNIIIYLPMEMSSKFVQKSYYDSIEIKVMDGDIIKATDKKINNVLEDNYPDKIFTTLYTEKLQSTVSKILYQFDIIIAIIGFFCLLVSGIGIMNMMIVNMNERKSEIGIMKALGATKKVIRRILLIELVFLGIFSGTIGFLGGIVVVIITQYIAEIYALPNIPFLLGISLFLGLGVVLAFGISPVINELKKEPIDSINNS